MDTGPLRKPGNGPASAMAMATGAGAGPSPAFPAAALPKLPRFVREFATDAEDWCDATRETYDDEAIRLGLEELPIGDDVDAVFGPSPSLSDDPVDGSGAAVAPIHEDGTSADAAACGAAAGSPGQRTGDAYERFVRVFRECESRARSATEAGKGECGEDWRLDDERTLSRAVADMIRLVRTRPERDPMGVESFVGDAVTDRRLLADIAAELTEERRRAIARALMQATPAGLVRHQIESFDRFMDVHLPRMIAGRGPLVVDVPSRGRRHVVAFGQVTVYKPSTREADGAERYISPQEARQRNLAYCCSVTATVRHTVFDISDRDAAALKRLGSDCAGLGLCSTTTAHDVLVCQVPCMLRSAHCHLGGPHGLAYANDECPNDVGGTFVINGSTKTLISQENMRTNCPCVMPDSRDPRTPYVCEVRSRQDTRFRSTSTLRCSASGNPADPASRPGVAVSMPYIEREVPLAVMFRLAGVARPADMEGLIAEHATEAQRADARRMRRFRALVRQVLCNEANASGTACDAPLPPPGLLAGLPRWPCGRPRCRASDDDDDEEEKANRSGKLKADGQRHGDGADDGEGAAAEEEEEDEDPMAGPSLIGSTYHADLCVWLATSGGRRGRREDRITFAQHILASEFLPHVGVERDAATFRRKAHYLARCVHRLLSAYAGDLPPDDRDHTMMKRVETAGTLLAMQFRSAFVNLIKFTKTYLRKCTELGKPVDMAAAVGHRRVTSSFKYAMSTGNWGQQKGGSKTTGVAQVHNHTTLTAALSTTRRINMRGLNKEGKLAKVRQLHLSSCRIHCIMETPEGGGCGLVKNMALGTLVRVGYDVESVVAAIARARVRSARSDGPAGGSDPYDPASYDGSRGFVPFGRCAHAERAAWTAVTVNGAPIGYAPDGAALAEALRAMRRAGQLPFDATVAHWPGLRQLDCHVDAGCCLSPVLRVARLPLLGAIMARCADAARDPSALLVRELVAAGVVEYVAKDEEEALRVAVDPDDLVRAADGADGDDDREPFTHVEVHPLLWMGACASTIPFLERNQAPRNIYQSSMQKQSTTVQGLNAAHATDSSYLMAAYTERPLVGTFTERTLRTDRLTMGQNVLVAIASHGYTVEDAIAVNRSAIQRGAFRSSVHRTCRDEEKARGTDASRFGRPRFPGPGARSDAPVTWQAAVATHPAARDPATGLHRGLAHPRPDQAAGAPCRGLRDADYSKLGAGGFAPPGTVLGPRDVAIGKVVNTEDTSDARRAAGASAAAMAAAAAAAAVRVATAAAEAVAHGAPIAEADRLQDEAAAAAARAGALSSAAAVAAKPSRVVRRDQSTILRCEEPVVVERVIETRTKDGAPAFKMVVRASRTPQLGDKYCLTDDHEVLTLEEGWLPFDALDVARHRVAVLHHGTGRDRGPAVAYRHPEALHRFDHDGPVYRIAAPEEVDLCVTLDHRMWVLTRGAPHPRLVPARDLVGKTARYMSNAYLGRVDARSVADPAALRAWSVALAAVFAPPGDGHGSCRSVGRLLEQRRAMLELDRTDSRAVLAGVMALAECESLPDAHGAPAAASSTTTTSTTIGDGHRRWTACARTAHRAAADLVQQLCLHAGWSAVVCPDGRVGDSWRVTFYYLHGDPVRTGESADEPERCWINDGGSVGDPVREEIVHYHGAVHCVSVPPGEVFYVRRNGVPCWTGNSSRHGQKGVLGMPYDECDMPFLERDGTPVVMIINPHAIPSRMTIGQIVEGFMGKVAVIEGRLGDGTPFGNVAIDDLGARIARHGYDAGGMEYLRNGETGERIPYPFFVMPCFYQRLKHVSRDKIHARARGPVQLLIRQPVEGRARQGGGKLGEMERDCIGGDARVSLCQASVRLDALVVAAGGSVGVRAYSAAKDEIEPDRAIAFADKGCAPCVRVYLEDGTHVDCTPDHRFMTDGAGWVEARSLLRRRVLVGAEPPRVDLAADMAAMGVFALGEYVSGCALYRILGCACMAGRLTRQGTLVLHAHCPADAKEMAEDLRSVCGGRPEIGPPPDGVRRNGTAREVRLSSEASTLLSPLLGGCVAGDDDGGPAPEPTWPMPVLRDDLPLPLVREFLGAVFGSVDDGDDNDDDHDTGGYAGGDGGDVATVCVGLAKAGFGWRVPLAVPAATSRARIVADMLARLGIACRTAGDRSTANPFVGLRVPRSQLVAFYERVGYRYDRRRSARLAATVSYLRLRAAAVRQTDHVIERARAFCVHRAGRPCRECLDVAMAGLRAREPLYGRWYLSARKDDERAEPVWRMVAPTAESYLASIGAGGRRRSGDGTVSRMGAMALAVVRVEPVGSKRVYDVQVAANCNFLANGAVVHNCMIAYGAAQFLHERLFEQSDPYIVPICTRCGLIAEPARVSSTPAELRRHKRRRRGVHWADDDDDDTNYHDDGNMVELDPRLGSPVPTDARVVLRRDIRGEGERDTDVEDLFRMAAEAPDTLRGDQPYCRNCRESDTVRDVKMPYACKLLTQELMACGIALRYRFREAAGAAGRKRSSPVGEACEVLGVQHACSDPVCTRLCQSMARGPE